MSFVLLGILNAQAEAAAAGGGPAYDLLESQILDNDNISQLTFSSLNSTYAADYTHLQIRGVIRGVRSAAEDDLRIQINGDTGANYFNSTIVPTSSSAGASQNYIIYNGMVIANSQNPSSSFSSFVIDILDPFSASKTTNLRLYGGYTGDIVNRLIYGAGLHTSTSALDSIKIYPAFGNYKTGSRLSLYGRKAS